MLITEILDLHIKYYSHFKLFTYFFYFFIFIFEIKYKLLKYYVIIKIILFII